MSWQRYDPGAKVACTTDRAVGFPCVDVRGTVLYQDPTGKFGWVRVTLDSGVTESFRNEEVRPLVWENTA